MRWVAGHFRLIVGTTVLFSGAAAFAAQNGASASTNPVDAPIPQSMKQSSQRTHDDQESRKQEAGEQVRQEEKQRILGIVPNFGTTYRSDAISLTAGQKMQLAFRSAIDPATFAISGIVAGMDELADENSGFGWGPSGYGKRVGAAYLDAFDGSIIGSGILPVILHQDPRYFRLGHGTATHRVLYALASTVICKHDNTGRWEPNYSFVGGNIIAGAISNLYYPSESAGAGQTILNGVIVTAEGGAGSVFVEFWPDLSRKLFHRDPTHGLDAQARTRDAAEKAEHRKDNQKQPLGTVPK